MSSSSPSPSQSADRASTAADEDLGPLAWVLDEIQKTLDSVGKSLRRFVREPAAVSASASEPDTGALRLAAQQLHQTVGALTMVGQPSAAVMVGAMEFSVQSLLLEPARCNEAAVRKIERAGFAVCDFLNAVLVGKSVSALALFPQYRDVLEMAGSDRVHPADLWNHAWHWADVAPLPAEPALVNDPAVRSRFDRDVLRLVQAGDHEAARRLHTLSLGLASGASTPHVASFWMLAGAFFEAIGLGLLPVDAYVKRAASRALIQYATLSRSDKAVSDRLGQDLLFFCAQAVPRQQDPAEALRAVRGAWGVGAHAGVDYNVEQFGRFDPLALAQARKRIETAKEMWTALSGGDVSRTRQVVDAFAQLGESLQKLHPPSLPMAKALNDAVDASLQSGTPPTTELSLEVATSVLYLEAAFEDLDPHDRQLTLRTVQLAERIERAREGGQSEPLEPWMEELYRRMSDHQSMGTVVDELHSHLLELEKSLDQFFRNPVDQGLLSKVPSQLMQMRGVFSVLGLDQAAQTVQHMRENVDRLMLSSTAEAVTADVDALGNNLGALGFLIDMLGYQPALAKRLFVYDEAAGELKPLMGRKEVEPLDLETLPPALTAAEIDAEIATKVAALAAPRRAAAPIEAFSLAADSWNVNIGADKPPVADTEVTELEDDDLQNIFLDEAREVLQNGLAAVATLAGSTSGGNELTVLRRAFHTLKGSARMVGFTAYGEAASAFEQLFNIWLAEQRPATPVLLSATESALKDFSQWVDAIAEGRTHDWEASTFTRVADALRNGEAIDDKTSDAAEEAAIGHDFAATDFPELELEPDRVPEPLSAFDSAESLPPTGDDIDFLETAHAAFAHLPQRPSEPDMAFELEFDLDPDPGFDAAPEHPVPMSSFSSVSPLLTLVASNQSADDPVKAIGPLRIGIQLYNVYLNEADEWSRQLVGEVGEWALETQERMSDSTIGFAHSLAGSSATVGFQSLSGMARLIETALQHLQRQGRGTPGQGAVLVAAADELRHLLHQFAAGFLRDPLESTLDALREVAEAPGLPTGPAPLEAWPSAPWTSRRQEGFASDVTLDDADESFDVADALDVDLFPVFEEEAAELLPSLGGALREWARQPDATAPRASILRTLHTLKGSARLAGAMQLGERAHRMESEIEAIGRAHGGVDREAIERLLGRFDTLQSTFDGLRGKADAGAGASSAASISAIVTPVPERTWQPTTAAPAPAQEAEPEQRPRGVAAPGVAMPMPSLLAPLRALAGQAVRIRTHLLDRLVAQAGEIIITRSRMETQLGQLRSSLGDLTGNLDRLRQQLRDVEVQAESQMQSRLAQAKDSQQGFDPLEFDRFTRVQELTRMMAESVNDVATVQRTLQKTVQATEDDLSAQARQARELQRGLLRTRMVEFEGISERLYRVVRQASKDAGKQVRLDITGGSIEMDRGVLERMTPAFEHLLRNSVAHGIENGSAREWAGKESSGLISIDLRQEGNDVSVSFRDDGAGLDVQRIADRAVSMGLLNYGEQISRDEAAELIFHPGFSTAEQVSELAGRGIGMDVVRASVVALGGRIETLSAPGQGTTFTLVLPLTTAVTHVVMVRAGALTVGIPSNLVEVVQRVTADELDAAYVAQQHRFNDEDVPLYWAGALLQSSARSDQPAARGHSIVIVRSASQRLALHVDDVIGNQEVVVKNLGPQLSRLPGMAAVSVLASGAVSLIYNPVALAAVHGEAAREAQRIARAEWAQHGDTAGAAALPVEAPLVLVVDDSITVRRVTQRLLQREGYRVALAVDGLQALERLQQERPAVVLSDIEMPRMDGFDLVRNIRADELLADLPVIMITSRIAAKHRELAMQLGVDHYLGKPYSEDELVRLVRSHAHAEPL
ncbi:Hpt domain-containing protein [Variovorax sp. RHLX14]|uniref:hybrid sensor histidine kinase/response regulator n=1 Tax=Variovorax sp. RHLX14 TaxID=1259731 RepID=UPI003F452D89